MALISNSRCRRIFFLALALFTTSLLLGLSYRGVSGHDGYLKNLDIPFMGTSKQSPVATSTTVHWRPTNTHPPVKYKPTPTWQAPAAIDPFPLLATSTLAPPPVPPYNAPRPGLHRDYNLTSVPPLFIGFTRHWPMLLQCVVGYITAGWPPESIHVVENTGVQRSNSAGKLTLQNPFYLNHTTLQRLGVKVVQTPVLLTFSQLQNFFLSTAHERDWPYYFYSHQDVLVFSFEDGADGVHRPGDRPWYFYDDADEQAARNPPTALEKGYRTIYENCLRDLRRAIDGAERWAFRWYQYDHLTLVNRAALDAVGGWDSLMPYYGSDCDMNGRLVMDGWSMTHRRAGYVNDVSTIMEDLGALYRIPGTVPRYIDPNPIPPKEEVKEEVKETGKEEEGTKAGGGKGADPKEQTKRDIFVPTGTNSTNVSGLDTKSLEYFRELVKLGADMGEYKYRDGGNRNMWQKSQHGGKGEPYYYPADGFASAFWVLAEAGREVYRQKWGHRECDLIEGTKLEMEDMWRVENDW